MYEQKLHDYFAQKEEELIAGISRLVAIPSVRGEAKEGMPFGEGPARALEEALKLAGEMGFATENVDGYVGTADLNDKETILHILAHLDVVDAGEGWTVTEPFTPKVEDGIIYGRGVDDDKGPVVCSMLAMKAVRDLGIPLKHNVKLIMGTDEECGSSDVAYYYSKRPYAPCAFSPDGEFPVINIEKGHYRPEFEGNWAETAVSPRVSVIHGGQRINVVPNRASAVVVGMTCDQLNPLCDQAGTQTGAQFSLNDKGNGSVEVVAVGTGGHAAMPEEANNALTALLALLGKLPLAQCQSTTVVQGLSERFPHGDWNGVGLGVAQEDELSGDLTLTFSMLELNESGVVGQFDSRFPLCANEENCKSVAEANLAQYGLTIRSNGHMLPAHHTPADSDFVRTLLRCYEQYTGNKGECLAIGGGTYVHDIPGGVAFGCGMPGFGSNLHAGNERVKLSDMLTAGKIFAQVIIDLCAE